MQTQLTEIDKYAATNDMKINHDKCKVMLFNTSISNDFVPELDIGGVRLEVVEHMKLLGVVISNDLKWHGKHIIHNKKGLQ